MRLKYIRTRCSEIIVFPDSQTHSEIKFRGEPLSAGFIQFGDFEDGTRVNCYGKSVSLRLQARRDDTALAMKQFYGDD